MPERNYWLFYMQAVKKKRHLLPDRSLKKSNKVQKFKQSETVKSSECHKLCEVIKAPLFAY